MSGKTSKDESAIMANIFGSIGNESIRTKM